MAAIEAAIGMLLALLLGSCTRQRLGGLTARRALDQPLATAWLRAELPECRLGLAGK
jgi:hypothetical protein